MLLFLDVVSPIPEFFIIEDNKLIYNQKITKKPEDKLSDHIFQVFTKMEKKFNFSDNLKKIAITTGPGSYTSLRVGAAFISGIHISKKIVFCPFSINDILKFKSQDVQNYSIGIYIHSANNQDFFCSIDSMGKTIFLKIDNNNFIIPSEISTIYYNYKKIDFNLKNIKQIKFSFIEELINNYKKLIFNEIGIIEPIYISNNKILN